MIITITSLLFSLLRLFSPTTSSADGQLLINLSSTNPPPATVTAVEDFKSTCGAFNLPPGFDDAQQTVLDRIRNGFYYAYPNGYYYGYCLKTVVQEVNRSLELTGFASCKYYADLNTCDGCIVQAMGSIEGSCGGMAGAETVSDTCYVKYGLDWFCAPTA